MTTDAAPAPTSKQWYLSKTLWLNLIALVSMILPPVREWLAANPVEAAAALAAVNTLLRFVTRDKLRLSSDGGPSGGTGWGAGAVALLLALSLFALPSCSGLGDYTVNGAAYYRDPGTGAKGGLRIVDGVRTWFGRVPVYDEDTGEQIGSAEVEISSGK